MIARAPGRVNLIGEHTEYNGGLALAFAVEQAVTVTVRPGRAKPLPFLEGLRAELELPEMAAEVQSELPVGAGLSSSAALCVALALALGAPVEDRLAVARLCQRVESSALGARTGLLDQMAILMSPPGGALLIDFSDLSTEPVSLQLGDWRLAVLDSGQRRALADSGYNQRRAEAERGHPARLRHVRDENQRVRDTVKALGRGDLPAVGELLDASHHSLRDLYEVSTPAVERTRERLLAAGAAGARIMGGGFGGSVLALFPPGARPPDGALIVSPSPPASLI